jgi:hypothetical protein
LILNLLLMATRLTDEALDHLKRDENSELVDKVCGWAGIKRLFVSGAITRGSRSLTTYKAVVAIAESMKVQPEDIIFESENQ